MKKILFRADAKPSIGIGDLMSLIHLSSYLDDFECFFLTQETPAAKGIAAKYGLQNIYWLKENAPVDSDVMAINGLIVKKGIDIVCFEITERKLTEYTGITDKVAKICVNFDGCIPHDIKLLINWDAAADRYYDTISFPDTKFLLGPKYVILPKTFYSEEIQNRTYSSKRQKILIAMGGADEFDFTAKVADTLCDKGLQLTIIVGAGYERKHELAELLDKRVQYDIKVNVQDMLSEYMNCDFAIGAGGLTSSELVASKTPSALIATYEHQIARCEYFDNEGWSRYLGFRQFDRDELYRAIEEFDPSFSKNIFETHAIVEEIKRISLD